MGEGGGGYLLVNYNDIGVTVSDFSEIVDVLRET